jgi:hypothetical protein
LFFSVFRSIHGVDVVVHVSQCIALFLGAGCRDGCHCRPYVLCGTAATHGSGAGSHVVGAPFGSQPSHLAIARRPLDRTRFEVGWSVFASEGESTRASGLGTLTLAAPRRLRYGLGYTGRCFGVV